MNDEPTDQAKLWDDFEAQIREAFEQNLAKMKTTFTAPPKPNPTQKNKPSIIPITIFYFDSERMLPLASYQYGMLGTHEELIGLIRGQHNDFMKTPAYRKSQHLFFNRLKDEFKMKDRDILDMMIPAADAEDRERVYNRLKQSRRRKKVAKRTTKSSIRSHDRSI